MEQHYYTENPVSEIVEKNFSHTIKNITLNFTSVSGVFAFTKEIDRASELLIKHFTPSGKRILDVGCGYGAIGLFLKSFFSDQQVVLSDINKRAVEYAKKNSSINNLNVSVVQGSLFEHLQNDTFDDIVTNPPIAAGKKLNIELIQSSFNRLNTSGALWLVAYHNKGGATLKGIMKESFGNVEDIEKSGGIRVYRSVKS